MLNGKATRKKTEHVKVDTGVEIETYKIAFSVDLMYFVCLTFFVTVSRDT